MEEVKAEEWLYRRGFATPEHKYMNPDGTATSRVFKLRPKDEGKLSVDVKSKTTPEASIADTAKFMLFEIANQSVIDIGVQENVDLKTIYDALPNNPAHALILGMDEEDDIIPALLAQKSYRILV